MAGRADSPDPRHSNSHEIIRSRSPDPDWPVDTGTPVASPATTSRDAPARAPFATRGHRRRRDRPVTPRTPILTLVRADVARSDHVPYRRRRYLSSSTSREQEPLTLLPQYAIDIYCIICSLPGPAATRLARAAAACLAAHNDRATLATNAALRAPHGHAHSTIDRSNNYRPGIATSAAEQNVRRRHDYRDAAAHPHRHGPGSAGSTQPLYGRPGSGTGSRNTGKSAGGKRSACGDATRGTCHQRCTIYSGTGRTQHTCRTGGYIECAPLYRLRN